jgi:hypothetical protein
MYTQSSFYYTCMLMEQPAAAHPAVVILLELVHVGLALLGWRAAINAHVLEVLELLVLVDHVAHTTLDGVHQLPEASSSSSSSQRATRLSAPAAAATCTCMCRVRQWQVHNL